MTVLMLVNFTGCTIIGLMVGSSIDKKNRNVMYPEIEKITKLKTDTPLKIDLRDDQYIEGRFQGLERMDSANYIQRYNSFRIGIQDKNWFPNINDTVFIRHQLKYRNYTRTLSDPFIFSGFDLNSIRLRLITKSEMMNIKFDEFKFIRSKNSNIITADDIKNYYKKGILPLQWELVAIQTNTGDQKIPLDNILMIELPKNKTHKWQIGLTVVGLIADAVWIYLAVDALNDLSNMDFTWDSSSSY